VVDKKGTIPVNVASMVSWLKQQPEGTFLQVINVQVEGVSFLWNKATNQTYLVHEKKEDSSDLKKSDL